jgi:hypothetical protein
VALGKHGSNTLGVVSEKIAGEHRHSFGGDYSSRKKFMVSHQPSASLPARWNRKERKERKE